MSRRGSMTSRFSQHRRRVSRPLGAVALATAGLAALAGCAGGGGGGGGALGSGETLTIITSQAPWNPAYEAVVKAFQEETGIKVDVRSFPNDDVKTQMLNDIQSGNLTYDVYQINEPDVAQFAVNGWLQPFTEIDPDYALDDEVFTYDDIPYWNDETKTFDEGGELVAVPLMGNLQLIIYREDIYEELGLEVPTTWEEVIENGRAVQEAEALPYGFVNRLQGTPGASAVSYDFMPFFNSQGATWFVDEGTDWTPNVNTPEGIRAAELFREAATLGPADTKALGQAQAIAVMQAGDSAQLQVVAAAANSMQDEANSNVVGQVGYAPLPAGPNGPAASSGLWTLAIPEGLEQERSELALQYIDWVTSKEGMTVFAENGGIPTRADAYESPNLTEVQQDYLEAVAASADSTVGQFRFEFSGEFLGVTETILADIAAGDIEPAAGMERMQEELTRVVEESGYPMG
jgi:multiple sugar transport system substrate-binding protein